MPTVALLRVSVVRTVTATKRPLATWAGRPPPRKSAATTTTTTRLPSLVVGAPGQRRQEATAILPPPQEEEEEEARKQFQSDLVVVLDMDECLIHSKFLSPQAARFAHQLPETSSWTKQKSHQVESFRVTLPDDDVVQVYQRPHLHEFLHHVGNTYETHIFTAAMEVYAKPILDHLDPQGTLFCQRWYRDSCTPQQQQSQSQGGAVGGGYVKNLSLLEKDAARMVLVDNNPISFLANPENGILVSSFYSDPNDNTLLAVLGLLQELDQEKDVRPSLNAKFGLKESLEAQNLLH